MISNSGTTSLGLYDFKRQIDAFGGVDYFRPTLAGGYLPNARVMLNNGEIVQNYTNGNLTNDPNVDMTGWVLNNAISETFTIEELSAFDGAFEGLSVKVGSPFNSVFRFTTAPDDSVSITGVGGYWVLDETTKVVYPDWFVQSGDIDDTESFQRALDYLNSIGGGTLLPLNDEYVVRNTNVPSNVIVGAFKIKQRIESEPLDQWALIKHVFHIEDSENIVFYKTSVDGQRGYQNMDNAGNQNGGCTAWYFGKNAKNVLLIHPTAHHMATDAVELHGYAGLGVWSQDPKNIKIIQPNFYANRRNNISILSVDGLSIDYGNLSTSGIEVDGNQSGRLPLPVSQGSPEIWSSPAIDIEPEEFCTINNVTVTGTTLDGCRSGWMIYSPSGNNRKINNVRFIDVTTDSPISGKHFEIFSSSKLGTVDIIRPILRGTGSVWLTSGHVLIESPRQLLANNTTSQFAFDSNITLSISGVLDLNLIDTQIGNYGLVTDKFGEFPKQDETKIRFGFNSRVSEVQGQISFITSQIDAFSRPPIRSYVSEDLAPLEHDNGNLIRQPIFWSSEDGNFGMGVGKKSGFIGKYLSEAFNRTIVEDANESTSSVTLDSTMGVDIGSKIELISSGRKRVYTVAEINSNTLTIIPPLTETVLSGTSTLIVNRKDWYGVSKQNDIADATSGTQMETINQILSALRKSNILGD